MRAARVGCCLVVKLLSLVRVCIFGVLGGCWKGRVAILFDTTGALYVVYDDVVVSFSCLVL